MLRSLAVITFCAASSMVLADDQQSGGRTINEHDLRSENTLREKLRQAKEKSLKKDSDPTANILSNLGKLTSELKARTVKQLSEAAEYQESHPAARELRKRIDEENEYVVKNNVEFTREMKIKRKKEVNDVLQQIAIDKSNKIYEEVMKKKAVMDALRPHHHKTNEGAGTPSSFNNGNEGHHGGESPTVALRGVSTQSYNEKNEKEQVEMLRQHLNTNSRKGHTEAEILAIQQQLKMGLDNKKREREERLVRKRLEAEQAAKNSERMNA